VLKTKLFTKLQAGAGVPLAAGVLVTTLLVLSLSELGQSSPAQQPAGKQPSRQKPVEKERGKSASEPVPDGALRARRWIVGTWRSYKLDYRNYKRWKGTATIELVATSPDEIGLFLISADGKRRRTEHSQPSLLDGSNLSFGPIADRISFRYRLSHRPGPRGLARDNVLTLDLKEGTASIHVELIQDRRFTEEQSKQIRRGMTVAQVTALLGCTSGDYTGGKGLYVAFIDPFPLSAFQRHYPVHWCGHTGAIGLVLDEKGKVRCADWFPALDPENAPEASQECKAAAEIKKLGGEVTHDEQSPGKPVVQVNLAGTAITDDQLACLAGLSDLRELDLGSTRISDKGLAHLRGLTSLQTLSLVRTPVSGEGLAHLKGLRDLRDLYLVRTQVIDANLIHLKGLTTLRELTLVRTPVTDAGLAHLKGLTDLRLLNLTGTNVTDRGLADLKELTKLDTLSLARTGVTDEGLANLKGLKDLRILDLRSTQVMGRGLAYLKGLGKVQHLVLAGSRVNDKGLTYVQGFTDLWDLGLEDTKVTDAGLVHLKGLTKLRGLRLDSTAVTDAGLVHLEQLKQLRTLSLSGTKVTETGVKRLREALPKTAIFAMGRTETGARQDAPRESPVLRAVERIKPALVSIQQVTGKGSGKDNLPKPVLGILLDSKRRMVTNHSLVKGWQEVEVVLHDGRRLAAKPPYGDPDLDLAVVEIEDAKPLPHAEVADSEKVKVGDFVVVLSSPWTVAVEELPVATLGVISGKARMTKKGVSLFAVDTSSGPGCSPGPLVSREGEFIGLVVNRELVPRGTNGAVPSKRILERLAEWSREGRAKPPVLEIEAKPRAAFGIGGFSYSDTAYAFSPDGKYFAVGGYGVLLLRDARTGKVLFDLGEELEKVKGHVRCVAFSPDSKKLAVGGYYGGFLRFWDVVAGKWGLSLEDHTGTILAIAFSPDGQTLATGGRDGTLRLWDVRRAKETARKKPHGDWVFTLAFSPDGKVLASAGADKDVLIWDLATGKPRHRLRGHENDVDSVVFSPDGKLLASGSRDGTTKLWDTATGKEVRQFRGAVGTFSPGGKHWISCGDSRLVVWDAATGARQAHILRPAPVYSPDSLAIAPDGKTLAVRCDSERIYLWDLDPLLPAEKVGKLKSPAFSPDGTKLVALSGNQTLRFWDAASGQERKRIVLTLDRTAHHGQRGATCRCTLDGQKGAPR
jgi:WD40 repeat protein